MTEGALRRLKPLRRCLPVVVTVLILGGLGLDAVFRADQDRRREPLREAGMVASRLLVAGRSASRLDEAAGSDGSGEESLAAAGSVAEALAQSFEDTPPAAAWLPEAPSVAALGKQWSEIAGLAKELQDHSAAALTLRGRAIALESAFIRMRVSSDDLLGVLAASEAKPAQLRAAARQLALVERLAAGARALAGEQEILAWADRVGRDALVFGDVLTALESGSRSLKIVRVLNRDALDILAGLAREFRQAVPVLEQVLDESARRPNPTGALQALTVAVQRAGELGRSAALALDERADSRFPRPAHLLWLALLAVLAGLDQMMLRARQVHEDAARVALAEAEAEARVEQAMLSKDALRDQIQQLTSCITQVAEGYTELHRQPADDEDSVVTAAFSAVERLMDRLHEHADQGLRLVRGGELLGDITRALRNESRRQSDVMEQMALATRDMASGLDPLTRDGQEAGEAARSSQARARQASDSVLQTVRELEALETSAQECSHRVRRLEEAARQVLTVRELTEEVSELGKLLSLNVAIQASTDSPVSRALGTFSDEVQRLADRARGAMLRIDAVHCELRDEAQGAAGAINDSLNRARAAAARAEGAGGSLEALDEVARRLGDIGDRLERRQREHARRVTGVVRSITALHHATSELRQQVDLTVDSSMALADAGAGYQRGLERRNGHGQVLPFDKTSGERSREGLRNESDRVQESVTQAARVLEPH